jgi:tRNA(Ile2) C34 agmatinyltransferase TiaS
MTSYAATDRRMPAGWESVAISVEDELREKLRSSIATRTCLGCGRRFRSSGPANRKCRVCRRDWDETEWGDLPRPGCGCGIRAT